MSRYWDRFILIFICEAFIASTCVFANKTTNKEVDANYSGVDAHGNFYRGNKNTGFYYNYGTGITCFGLNKQRKCYKTKA